MGVISKLFRAVVLGERPRPERVPLASAGTGSVPSSVGPDMDRLRSILDGAPAETSEVEFAELPDGTVHRTTWKRL